MFFHHFWRNRIAVVEDIFSRIFWKNVSTPENPTLTLKKQVFEARNSSRMDHLDRRHQCKFIFLFFYEISENRSKTLNFVTYRPKNDDSTSWKIDEIHENLGKSMKFSCFWHILEKSYCCRWRYFSLMFRKKVLPPVDPTLTLKNRVFEARNSSRIDHLDRRHQCKFIFSWNFENRSKC